MSRTFGHGPFSFAAMSPVLRGIIVANAALFLLSLIVGGQFIELFGLVPAKVLGERWVWQPVTYLFIHGNFLHLLFNLFALWMFGMHVESQWGSREFLKYYLLCGVGAGLCNVLAAPGSMHPVIGSSGAIYGLLVAFAMLYPEAVIYLYFFFPLKAKHFALLCGLIEFFAGASQATPGVARLAHLSGMLIGYFYIRWWWIVKIRAKALFGRLSPEPRPARRAEGRPSAARDAASEIDRILDKILAQGEGSLTEDERETLRRQAKDGKGEGGRA